jgi:hypothetical protein
MSTMFRSKGERIVDKARSAVAGAEMVLAHSFEPMDRSNAYDALQLTKRYLARAEATLAAWNAVPEEERSDDDVYPDVPETDQNSFI